MITFNKVRYKNLLSTGNAPIEVQLSAHHTSLIVGQNGAGKSTINEAICFALFGRPLRNVNKPQIVNSINRKECVVELEFSVGKNNYRIVRGIKPNVFEIYENGTLIPAPASIQDYQSILETHILHMNYKSFMQIVVLGGSSYIPFMKLTSQMRRELIESLLDIEVFSSMNALTKEDLQTTRTELEKCQQAKVMLAEQRKMAQNFTEHIQEQRDAALAALRDAIVQEEKDVEDLESQLNELQVEAEAFDSVKKEHAAAVKKQHEYERMLGTIDSHQKKITKEWAFYEEHDNCPTCEQSITEEFKSQRYAALEQKETASATAHTECMRLIEKYQKKAAEANTQLEQAATIERQIVSVKAKLPIHRRRIEDLKTQLDDMTHCELPTETVDVNAIDQQLDAVNTQHAALSRKRVIIDAANMLLKDNGIKSRIIRHYIPIINKQINHYLNAMDFPIQFTLDEDFVETIKSRHRDEFSYELFSDGEKKRIDMALLLTWRNIASLKNNAETNLLVLDEVFDSSLDAAAAEEITKIINTLDKKWNIFVISHKTDQLIDKFSHVIKFEKSRGFSQMVQGA